MSNYTLMSRLYCCAVYALIFMGTYTMGVE